LKYRDSLENIIKPSSVGDELRGSFPTRQQMIDHAVKILLDDSSIGGAEDEEKDHILDNY